VEKKRVDVSQKWVWRCHIDITEPDEKVMSFFKPYIEKYNRAIFSAPAFARRDLNVRQIMISPSIDPLSDKNKELPQSTIDSTVEQFGIDKDRPIVTQISRFDKLKDPSGVIEVYKRVKKYIDCQLVLAGGGATDDPEGIRILGKIKESSKKDPDIHVIYLPPSSDIAINALQRASTVVLQKSLKEGFGLTVTEALWKAKPVIASAVGGIPLQITHKNSGILTYSLDGTAHYLKELLNEPEYANQLGINGREHVRNNFLITRHIRENLLLFLSLFHDGDLVYL
jgi:trehalose synthase